MKEKIENLKKGCLISFSTIFNLSPTPGWKKYVVTKDKKLHTFEFYHRITPFMEEHNIPKESSFEYDLTDEQYNKLEKFIEENINGKSFEPIQMRDYSCSITGENFYILNHNDLYDKGFEIIKSIMNTK